MVLGAICGTIDIIAPPLKLQAFLMIDDVGAHISRAETVSKHKPHFFCLLACGKVHFIRGLSEYAFV